MSDRKFTSKISSTLSSVSPKIRSSSISISNAQRHLNIRENKLDSIRIQLLLPTPAVNVQRTFEANYTDQELIDFLKQPNGEAFLERETTHKPVHILADFNYVPLNQDLELASKPGVQGTKGKKDSSSAKMWRRNTDARIWRDWVANSIMFENYVGEENPGSRSDPRAYKIESDGTPDRMSISLNASHPIIKAYNKDQIKSRDEIAACFKKMLEIYSMIYQIDNFVIEAVNAQPRQHSRNLYWVKRFGVLNTGMFYHSYINKTSAESYKSFLKSLIFHNNYNAPSAYSSYNDPVNSYDSLKHNFNFENLDDQEFKFKFDKADDWKYFVKSTCESIRNINHYIENLEFTYNDEDEVEFVSDKNVYSKAAYEKVTHQFTTDNLYSAAIRIRNKVLKAKYNYKYESSGEDPSLDLKSPHMTAATKVVSQGLSISRNGDVVDVVEDDIQKLLSRTKVLKKGAKAVTISPYLVNDAIEKSASLIMHFMTIRDILIMKKTQLLDLIDNINSKLGDADFDRKIEILKGFPFEHGPQSLIDLTEKLIDKINPINGSVDSDSSNQYYSQAVITDSSIRDREALVLLDPRNIVAHLTKRKVGRYIYNSALLVSHYTNSGARSSGTKLSNYVMGVFRHNGFGRASKLLLGSGTRSNQVSVFTQNLVTGEDIPRGVTAEGGTVGATVAAGGTLDDDSNSLINGTVIRSISPAKKRKYIFYAILMQLSEKYDDPEIPFFSKWYSDVIYSQAANSLYATYHERINQREYKRDRKNPRSKYFEENKEFTRFSLNQKKELFKELNETAVRDGFDNSSLVLGLFSNVSRLVSKVDSLPRNRDRALAQYRRNIVRSLEAGTGMSPNSEGFPQAVQEFFGLVDSERNYSNVIQDFVFDSEGGFNTGRPDRNYDYQARVGEMSSLGSPLVGRRMTAAGSESTVVNNKVIGIRGIGAGGPKERTGFANLNINDGVKEAAIEKLRAQVLNPSRNDNFLVMLAEAICAQLFYGFPNEDSRFTRDFNNQNNLSDIFEKIDGNSHFNDNPIGIFRALNLVTESPVREQEKIVNISDDDLFDIVWEYVKIAEVLTNELPKVRLKFKQVQNSDTDALASGGYYQTRDTNNYFLTAKRFSDNVERTLRSFNSQGGNSSELAYQLNEYAARANEYFRIVENELSKEPIFRLSIESTNRNVDEWSAFALHSRSGFLPHVTINSQYQRQKIALYSDPTELNRSYELRNGNFLYRTVALADRRSYDNHYFGSVAKKVNFNDKLRNLSQARMHGLISWYGTGGEDTGINFDNSYPETFFGYPCVPKDISSGGFDDRNEQQNLDDFSSFGTGVRDFVRDFYRSRVGLLPASWYNDLLEKMPIINDIVTSSQTFRGKTDNFAEDHSSDWVTIYPLSDPIIKFKNRFKFEIKLKKKTYTFAHAFKATPTYDFSMKTVGGVQRMVQLPEFVVRAEGDGKADHHWGNNRYKLESFRDLLKADFRDVENDRTLRDESAGGPVDILDVTSVEQYRKGYKNARWTMANLFLVTSYYYSDSEGRKNNRGMRLASNVDGWAKQFEYAKMFYHRLKEDPVVRGWGHQVWDWSRTGTSDIEGINENPEEGGNQGSWYSSWIDGQNHLIAGTRNTYAQMPTRQNREYFSAGWNPPNPVDPTQRHTSDPELVDWVVEYTTQFSAFDTVPLNWIDAYRNAGEDAGIVKPELSDAPKIVSTAARQVFLGKAEGLGNADLITEADTWYRRDIEYSSYVYGTGFKWHPEFYHMNFRSGAEEIEGEQKEYVKYLYFNGVSGDFFANWSEDLLYIDGSGEIGQGRPTTHPLLADSGLLKDYRGWTDQGQEEVYLPNFTAQVRISGENQPFVNKDLNWFQDNMSVNIPFGSIAFDYFLKEGEDTEFGVFGPQDNGPIKKYIVDERLLSNSAYTSYYLNRFGVDESARWSEPRWSEEMAKRVKEKIESEKPNAIRFFRNMLDEVNSFSQGYSRFAARKARATVAQMPYFIFWQEEHPYMEITVQREYIEDYFPPDIAVVPNYSTMARDVDAVRERNWINYTDVSIVQKVDNLEQQYYQYLYSQKQYSELYKKTFDLAMDSYAEIAKDLKIEAVDNKTSKIAIEQISKIGFMNVTPEVLDNFDALRIQAMSHGRTDKDGDHDAWYLPYGNRGRKSLEIVPGFKLTPLPTPNNHGSKSTDVKSKYFGKKHNQLDSYKKLEREFFDSNLIDENTRVCFVAIESGELGKVLSAPEDLDNYDENQKDGRSFIHGPGEYAIELELFDYFRPWVVLKFDPKDRDIENRVLNFTRGVPAKISADWDIPKNRQYWWMPVTEEADIVEKFKKGITFSPLGALLDSSTKDTPNALAYLNNTSSGNYVFSRDRGKTIDDLELLSVFLKVYASQVLGVNFFEYTIPYLNSHAPVGDYFPDKSGDLPEERNYQEPLRESLMNIIKTFKEAATAQENSAPGPQHLLKYFFDRTRFDETSTPAYAHFDEVGRQDVFKFSDLNESLFSEEAIDLENKMFYPFKFEQPITRRNLAAAEILTSVNEVFSNVKEVLAQFEHGFSFDNIVGLTYKLSDFVLHKEVRMMIDGKEIDIPEEIELQNGKEIKKPEILIEGLPYLNTTDGRVKPNAIYPLTLRAKIKKIDSRE